MIAFAWDGPARYASRLGRRLASLMKGGGLSSLTVCGLRPRDARFSFFCARSGGGLKAFSLSGWEGHCPVGFARPYSSREKRSPPRDPRGVPRETIPSTANKGRCTPTSVPFGSPYGEGIFAGRVRLCPLPTFSGRFRYSGRVTASCDAGESRSAHFAPLPDRRSRGKLVKK